MPTSQAISTPASRTRSRAPRWRPSSPASAAAARSRTITSTGSIRTAAEQFLGKSVDEIEAIALQTVEGHLRAIIGTLTVEEIYRNRDQFAGSVQDVAVSDLANMGLEIVSFALKDIRDSHGYLEALGKPKIAEVKRDAVIAQAEADRDATIRSAQARQKGETAKFEAETQIADAEREYKTQKAGFDASVNLRRAEADLAYDIQKNRTSQELKREEVQIAIVEKEQQVVVQEREIQRREKELEATIKRQAYAERYGEGTGASKLTGDVTRIMTELPAVFESLSGVDLRKLIEAVPALKAAMKDRKPEPEPEPE